MFRFRFFHRRSNRPFEQRVSGTFDDLLNGMGTQIAPTRFRLKEFGFSKNLGYLENCETELR
jgi:hypothetical protein